MCLLLLLSWMKKSTSLEVHSRLRVNKVKTHFKLKTQFHFELNQSVELHFHSLFGSHMSHINIFPVTGYTRRMIAYDTKANRFIKCANLKERKMHHSATVLNDKLYVTGGRYVNGHDIIEDSDTFECYDSKTDTWKSKGSLPYKLFDHGSLTLTCVSQTWEKS